MTENHRHVLFFSNYCPYCRSVLDKLSNRGTRAMFVLVCVDRRQQQLPEFVDRVPLIYTNDHKILTDESVSGFIQRIAEQSLTMSDEDVIPWTMAVGSGICKSFSFLETNEGVYGNNYSDINQNQSIYTPADDSGSGKGSDTSSSSAPLKSSLAVTMESIMAQRDDDVVRYLPPRPRIADS